MCSGFDSDKEKIKELKAENERLLKQLENISLDEANIRADVLLEQQDYKSRCEKANKTLKNWEKLELDDLLVAIRKTQKILNGRSDE